MTMTVKDLEATVSQSATRRLTLCPRGLSWTHVRLSPGNT